MTPSPYKIFCIGVIWFIYTLTTFIHFVKNIIKRFIHFIVFSFICFYYRSEKEFFLHLEKTQSITYPTNLAIVLNKFLISEQKIIFTLCQFIRWIIFINKIKYLTIYDAFNLIDIQQFIKEITEQINNNKDIFENNTIHIAYKDINNGKIMEEIIREDNKNKNKNLLNTEKDLYICLIGFKEANDDLINKIIKEKETKIYNNYPDVYKWFNKRKVKNNDANDKSKKEFEKYLTRKNEESLPELVVTFGKNKYLFYEDICLYGFPFTLLENTEIINVNHKQFDQIDFLDFIDIFKKNSKIVKRFGT
jgi:hypothetical protein